jgi:hypothetical protein
MRSFVLQLAFHTLELGARLHCDDLVLRYLVADNVAQPLELSGCIAKLIVQASILPSKLLEL